MKARYYLITVHLLGLFLATVAMAATNRTLSTNGDGAVITPPWNCGQNALKQFTVSAWCNPAAATGATERVIMERAVRVPQGNPIGMPSEIRLNFRLGADSLGRLFVSYHASGTELIEVRAVTQTAKLAAGRWTHIAGRYDGQNLTLFCDGISITSVPSADIPCNGSWGALLSVPEAITIGAKNNDPTGTTTNLDSCFVGAIDEVVVWEGALSDAQIRASMNTKPTGAESNLVGYWNFDDGTARDMSTNAVNGVYYNSTNVMKNVAFPTTARIDLFPEVAISFQTIQDMTYQVQSSNDLMSTNWTPTNTNVTGNGFEMTVIDTNSMWLARFYRVCSL